MTATGGGFTADLTTC